MRKSKFILFTSGRGPVECALAVQGVQMKFKEYIESQNISYEIVKSQLGPINNSLDTIVFKVEVETTSIIDPWYGTIQWICKSPIRKTSKRKNWFLKCCEMFNPESKHTDLKDISIHAYKSSGPGGQHRNKVETAVRIIHNPSGIIVTSSDSKSKNQNKKTALTKLKRALMMYEQQEQKKTDLKEWSDKIDIERGNPSKAFYGPKFIELKTKSLVQQYE